MGTERQSGESTTSSSPLSSRIVESVRLSRFFSTLLSEATALNSTSIVFTLDGEAFNATLYREKEELKAISIRPTWIQPICRWLAERRSWNQGGESMPSLDEAAFEFFSSVRSGESIVSFKVNKHTALSKRQTVTLSKFSKLSVKAALEELDFDSAILQSTEEMLHSPAGIIAVAAPRPELLDRSRAYILAVSGGHYVGDLTISLDQAELGRLSETELLIVGVRSSDAIDSMLKLRQASWDLTKLNLLGVICQGLAKRVCSGCGRETSVDQKLISALPPGLQPSGKYRYLVGRGCGSCGNTGYKGTVGIQSVLRSDPKIIELFNGGATESKLLDYAHERGTRPLLEDGVRKALAGKVTFESVFDLTVSVPDAYLRYYPPRTAGQSETKNPLVARWSRQAVEGEGGTPELFEGRRLVKKRDKPLVLVVEDNHDQREILELVLKTAEYDVATADDGVAAMEFIQKEIPDLVISDLMMPRMDGTELVTRLKGDPKYINIPILVLTVLTDSDKEYALLDLGADDYCEKTIQKKILLKRVENLVRRKDS